MRLCPVCWQPVFPTPIRGLVYTHLVLGARCDMSGHDFDLCYPMNVDPKLRGAA